MKVISVKIIVLISMLESIAYCQPSAAIQYCQNQNIGCVTIGATTKQYYFNDFDGWDFMVSAWDDPSSMTAYTVNNLAVAPIHSYLCGYKYHFITGGGTLSDLTALFCSMIDPSLPAEEQIVVKTGSVLLTTMACPAGQRVTAVQYAHGPMSGTSPAMAIKPEAEGGLGIPVTPSDIATGTSSYIDGPECLEYTGSDSNWRLSMSFPQPRLITKIIWQKRPGADAQKHAVTGIKIDYWERSNTIRQVYKNGDIIPTGETLAQIDSVKNEIILDPPIFAAKLDLKPVEHSNDGSVADSRCNRFDLEAWEFGISKLSIGCDTFQPTGTRQWLDSPDVALSYVMDPLAVSSVGITEVVATTSPDLQPGIRQIGLWLDQKSCVTPNHEASFTDYEGLIGDSGIYEWAPNPGIIALNGGDCYASVSFERVNCGTGESYTDSYSFNSETGAIGIDTDTSGRTADGPTEEQCVRVLWNSGYWNDRQYEMQMGINYRICMSVYQVADFDPEKVMQTHLDWADFQKPVDEHTWINEKLAVTNPDRNFPYIEYCNRTNIELYLYEDGSFNPASTDWFSYDPETEQSVFFPWVAGAHRLFFAFVIGDHIQDYARIDVSVCGEEQISLKSEMPDPAVQILQFGQGVVTIEDTQYIWLSYESNMRCYKPSELTIEKGHFFLWKDEAQTDPWTNTTEIWIDDQNGAEENFGGGFTIKIETDKFWNRNFTIWYQFITKGQVSISKQIDIQIGPNCGLEEFNVTGLDGEDLGFPDEWSLKTIQMVIVPDEATLHNDHYIVDFNSQVKFESNQPLCMNWYFTYRSYFTMYFAMADKERSNCPIKSGQAIICKFYDPNTPTNGGIYDSPHPIQDFETTLTWDPANPSEDQTVLTAPFKPADMNDDQRLRTGLRVSATMDTTVHKMIVEITNNNDVSQYFLVNIMICGQNHPVTTKGDYTTMFPISTVHATEAFEKIFMKNDQDDVFTTEGKYIMNLADLYEVSETTTWRDSEAFLESLSSRCLELSYMLCQDELCETEYTDSTKATIEDFLGDGTTQLVINTLEPFDTQIFYLRVKNTGRQEYVSMFDIHICGAEILSNVGEQLSTSIVIDSINHGESFTFDLFQMFETTGGEKCPTTNITFSITTEIVEIDNTLRFNLGEEDVLVQTVEEQTIFYEQMVVLTNDTVDLAQIVVDTSLVDLTTRSTLQFNVTAMSESLITVDHTFNFDFSAAQKEKLNTLPIAADNFTDAVVELNLNELPSDPFVFTFTFNDTDKHNMIIYADGNETFPLGVFTTSEQNLTQRNFTLEMDVSDGFDFIFFGLHEFTLVVADEYGSNMYPWSLLLVDITPPFTFPETPPAFTTKPEKIEIAFIYGENLAAQPVQTTLPEAYDMNDDAFEIIFDEAEYAKWAHFIFYDGVSTVVVDPSLMLEDDIQYAMKEEEIELPLVVVDVKGYSRGYKLKIEFEIEVIEDEVVSTFAGVNMAEVDARLEQETIVEEVVEEVKEEELDPDLIAQVREISTLGKMIVDFTPGYRPPGELNELSNFMIISIKPGSADIPIDKFEFQWEMEEFDEVTGEMTIQVNFTFATWISASALPDILEVKLIDYEQYFPESRRRMQEVGQKEIEIKNHTISIVASRQMPNNEATQAYDASTESMSFWMVLTTIYTLVLSMVLASAVKKLLLTLLTLQVIIHMFMFMIPFPGNISNVIKKIKPIVSFNLMKSLSKYTEDFFGFDKLLQIQMRDQHIIPSIQDMGVKHLNCIVNLKNIFQLLSIFFLQVAFALALRVIIIFTGKCVARYKVLSYKLFFAGMIQIVQAGFIPITIACFLQISYPLNTTTGERLGYKFGLATAFITFIVYPILMIGVIFASKETLMNPEIKQRFGPIYNGHNIDTPLQRGFRLVFILRRWLVLYIAFFLYETPYYQVIGMNLLNMFALIYHGQVEPFNNKHARNMDFFNEFTVMMITYFMFMFNDNIPDEDLKFMIGWVMTGLFAFIIAFNSYFVLKRMVKDTYLLCLKKFRIFKHRFFPDQKQEAQVHVQEKEVKMQAKNIKRKMKRLMTRSMPKSGLISSKNLNNPGVLSIITEQEFEESKPDEEFEKPSIQVPITAENAYRFGHTQGPEPLPFSRTNRDISFANKKPTRLRKKQPLTKISFEPPKMASQEEISKDDTEMGKSEMDQLEQEIMMEMMDQDPQIKELMQPNDIESQSISNRDDSISYSPPKIVKSKLSNEQPQQ